MTTELSGHFDVGGAMVKVGNRKSRAFQAPGDKSYGLDEHEARLRERLLLVNRVEGARLERLQRQITSGERANVGRILRSKDQTRVTLINIASTRRKIHANVGDFERRLKDGTNSPVFSVELERLQRRERELSGLLRKLQGPNSQLLAAHLRDELRNIESRLDASPSRVASTSNPTSVVAIRPPQERARILPVTGNTSDGNKTMTNNVDELVKEVDSKMSETNISQSTKRQTNQAGTEHESSKFPVTQPMDNDVTTSVSNMAAVVSVAKDNNAASVSKRGLPPLRVSKNRKQKYLALLQQKLASRTAALDSSGTHEISSSALALERRARKRMAELKVRTREDIQGRRTADSDESLGSIRRQEAVTRLQTSRLGPTLPRLGKKKNVESLARPVELSRSKKRESRRVPDSGVGAVLLPPLRIDNSILKELKESRRKHKNQSLKLPKLP